MKTHGLSISEPNSGSEPNRERRKRISPPVCGSTPFASTRVHVTERPRQLQRHSNELVQPEPSAFVETTSLRDL